MIRIAIVDDHQLFRKSLALLVGSFDGCDVVFTSENGHAFLKKLKTTSIDVVLLDIQMPEMDGFQTSQMLHKLHPDVKILIVSQLTTKESIHKVMELGAHGYFTKNSDPDQLETAINDLYNNGYYFGIELGSVLREAILWEKTNVPNITITPGLLSYRELEIIKMASVHSSSEIAAKLCINTRTVESHRKRIMEKTNAKNFIGVILFTLRHNYLSLEDL